MTNQPLFPQKPDASITKDEVINYLLQQKHRGYQVHQASKGSFELTLDEIRFIRFTSITEGKTQVQGFAMNNLTQYFDCSSLSEVTRAVDVIAHNFIGDAWRQSPATGRVSANTPATNLSTISGLIGNTSIQSIFDPYLENRSLAEIINILSFGNGTVANGIQVLSTAKTTP
ncbi:MAG: hypothetical protein HOK99_07830 [Betaproteobacteria bacterium]|jgi:hypothetical protein|nr:hypothetical protein [Betaproteobacteria bacterium]